MKDRRRAAFWILLVSGLSAFALAMGYRWFERGGAFDLDTVRIRGIRVADSSTVCEVIRPLFGTSIWQIDPSEVQLMLSVVPGMDSVKVSRAPLNSLIIDIRISDPVFAVSDSTGTYTVSSRGEVLPQSFLTDSIPVIESLIEMDSGITKKLAAWFRSEEIKHDSLLCRYSDTGLSVFVNSDYEVLLGVDRLSERWACYKQLAYSLPVSGNWHQIDMRYASQAILRTDIESTPSQEDGI